MSYKDVLVNYTEPELKEKARAYSYSIVFRAEEADYRKKATAEQAEIITNIIYGALLAIRWRGYHSDIVKGIIDTAEFTADLMIKDLNGYESVYNPLWEILKECQEVVSIPRF